MYCDRWSRWMVGSRLTALLFPMPNVANGVDVVVKGAVRSMTPLEGSAGFEIMFWTVVVLGGVDPESPCAIAIAIPTNDWSLRLMLALLRSWKFPSCAFICDSYS